MNLNQPEGFVFLSLDMYVCICVWIYMCIYKHPLLDTWTGGLEWNGMGRGGGCASMPIRMGSSSCLKASDCGEIVLCHNNRIGLFCKPIFLKLESSRNQQCDLKKNNVQLPYLYSILKKLVSQKYIAQHRQKTFFFGELFHILSVLLSICKPSLLECGKSDATITFWSQWVRKGG